MIPSACVGAPEGQERVQIQVARAEAPVCGILPVPPSKSLHQRALVLAALAAPGATVAAGGGQPGDDVVRLDAAITDLGTWQGDALGADREPRRLDLGLGGTGLRFSIALATLRPPGARTLVTGARPLLRRPHRDLVRALRRLGGRIKRRQSGAWRVRGGGVTGRPLTVPATRSSQYASALLLIAPRIGGLELTLADRPVSRPYLELTVDLLGRFGVPVEVSGLDAPGGRIAVAESVPQAVDYRVEADASSAAPWWAAAALTGGEVEVADLPWCTVQADRRLLDVLERMGVTVEPGPRGGARVRGPGGRLQAPGDVDLRDASDLLPLVGALAAAAVGETRVTGVAHARGKESDRLASVAAAVRAIGGQAEVEEDALRVRGTTLRGGCVNAAGDHRLVLAFGVLGLAVAGIAIDGAEAVSKSYPGFPRHLAAAARGERGRRRADG